MLPSRLHRPKSWWSIGSSGAMAPAPLPAWDSGFQLRMHQKPFAGRALLCGRASSATAECVAGLWERDRGKGAGGKEKTEGMTENGGEGKRKGRKEKENK